MSQVNGTGSENSRAAPGDGLPEIGARLDRLGMSKTVWILVGLLAAGGFLDAYMLATGSNIAPSLIHGGLLAAKTKGFFSMQGYAGFTAATFIGLLVATACFAVIADKFGRRTVFTVGLLWFSISGLILAFQTTTQGLIFWRFMIAIGTGLEVITIDSYLSELIPKMLRGRAFAVNGAIHSTGQPMASLMAFMLVGHTFFDLEGWRWVVLAGSIGAIVIWPLRLFIPESPRWLAAHDRLAEADKIVSRLEARVERDRGEPLPPPQPVTFRPPHKVGRYTQMFSGEYLPRTIMLSIFHVLQAIGLYGFINWMPTFLLHQGVDIEHIPGYTLGMTLLVPFGPILCLLFADKFERKYQIIGGALGVAIAGLGFAYFRHPYILIPLGSFELLSAAVISYNFHAYQAELFPTRIRVQAVGFVYSWSRISATFSGFLIAFVLSTYGVSSVFLLITGSMLMVALAIATLGPKTKDRSLETLSP